MFHPEGWDWRWLSWRQAARRVALWAGPLSALPPGARVAFAWTGHPASAVLDLAVQAAGRIAVPVERGRWPERDLAAKLGALGCRLWAAPEGIGWPEAALGEAGAGFDLVRLPAWQRPGFAREEVLPPETDPRGGGAVVEEDGIPFEAKAEELAAALPVPEGGRHDREIVVLGGPLLDAAQRRMLAWATAAGAAVLLDPDPERRIASAIWARPTVFHGTAAEIARLRAAVEKDERSAWRFPWSRRRRPRLGPPFGRLRTVVAVQDFPEDETAFWAARGVRLLRLPRFRAG